MLDTVLFYVFSAVAIGASLLVIGQRNPMYSIMLLIASFGALSALYIQLDAPFVAVAQIIVYAGAIMVLFLFVVMLLNAPQEDAAQWDRAHPLRRPGVSRFGAMLAALLTAAAGVGAAAGERCECGGWRAGRRRGAHLRPLRGPRAVYRLRVCVRGDLHPDSRRDGWRGRPGRARGEAVIPLGHYLVVSAILFAIGTAGVFLRRNLITILLSVEIMLNAVNLSFVAFGRSQGTVDGQIITFFVMTVAAAEAAVGLAVVDRAVPSP
jgi:NADH:ubiquinone oxidoreductase subunit K/NADH:ubiquinone oxidoreductase subunit 6 (subunit J)